MILEAFRSKMCTRIVNKERILEGNSEWKLGIILM